MNALRYSVGLDISKSDIEACILLINDQQKTTVKATRSFGNRTEGFNSLLRWVDQHYKLSLPIAYTMEATGIYYEALAWHLFQHQKPVAVVLPNKAKRYQQSLGLKSKNDKIDAKGLALMGAQQRLRLWQPLSPSLYAIRLLTRQHQGFSEQKTVVQNQLHAYEHSPFVGVKQLKRYKAMIKFYDKQLDEIKQEITDLAMRDQPLNERIEKITVIKGVKVLTVATVVAETNGFAAIENKRQLCSYAGYDVVENQSGKHVGRTKISKKGNARIRRVMHLAALNAVRYQGGVFKALYERVYARTGIKMKGYVAVQRKLLQLIYHLWKKNEAFKEMQAQASPLEKEVAPTGGATLAEPSLTDRFALREES